MKKILFLASLAVMTVTVWGMENYITPDSSPSKNSDKINISDTSVSQNSVANKNVEFQSFQQSLRTIQCMQKIIINQIDLLSLFPQEPEYFNYLLSLDSFMYRLCLPKNNTEAEETLSYMQLVFRDLKNHYDEDFEKLVISQIFEYPHAAKLLPDQNAYPNEQLGLEENNLNFNESNNLTNEHSTTSNDVFLSVLNDLPIAQSRNESGWDFNGFHSNVGGSLDMSQLADDNSTEIILQNTDRKGKRRAEESEDVQESAKKIRRDDQNFRDPNVATSSQSAVTEETSSLSSSQEMDNQHTSASPTASPMVLPVNQQAISTEKLKEMIELPECPEEYEKAFFNAIEEDLNIDEATAKNVIAEWRIFYLEAFRSVRGLTEETLKEWRPSKKYLNQNEDPIFKDLLTKIREKKDELCNKYKGLFTKNNIRKLIEYHDFMLIRLDDSCSYFYNSAICCNNDIRKSKKILSWLENHNLAEKKYSITDGEREDILSQIIENKQFEEIQRTYPKLSKQTYDNYVRYIKYWFSFKEQEVFKKKINGEELDEELKPLGLEKSTLDTNAVVDLIRFDKYYFIEQYKDYDYEYYQYIASVWKILAAKNFEKPNWCNEDAVSEKKVEANKRKSESIKTAQNDTEVAWNYLKFIDKNLPLMRTPRPNKKKNVISFYKWKLDKYESMNPKKSIRGTKSEFTKNVVYEEVRKYFDLHGKDMRRIFEPYRGETKELKALKVTNKEAYNRILNERTEEYYNIPAENIAAEVDAKIGAYQKKYNILVVLNDNRSGKEVDPEVQFESQKIIRDLWEMGFSYKGVIELLGLKDDFTNYRSTVENQTGSSSSSSTAQTRKRKADSTVESISSKKRNKEKQPEED